MRSMLVALTLLAPIASAQAQVSFQVQAPGLSIGLNVPTYPELVQVPGYPVYYDPRADANYFFYDGRYWVYQQDRWYSSAWYNGPWQFVAPEVVPAFVLRVPIRYYRRPPAYFRGWRADAPPRWGDHWGRGWEHRRAGWDRWDRRAVPPPAPLPIYQRQYAGDRYPHAWDRQQAIRAEHAAERSRRQESRGHGGDHDRREHDHDRGEHDRDRGEHDHDGRRDEHR